MSALPTLPSPPSATLRDALVRVLACPREGRDPSAHVSVIDPVVAALVLPAANQMLFLLAADGATGLAARLRQLARSLRPGTTHLAVVGGGPEVRSLLRRARPLFALDRRLVVHHVTDGDVWSAGGRLDALVAAAREVSDTLARGAPPAPLSTDEIDASRERLRQASAQESAFAAALARRWPAATHALLGAIVALYGLEVLWGGTHSVSTLWRMGANDPSRVALGEAWRLLSSAFLHTGPVHVVVNLFAIWSLAPFLERLLGTRRLVLLYGLSALGAGMASAWAHRTDASVGASGAIFGLMAGVVVLSLRPGGLLSPGGRAQLRRQLWPPLALVLAHSFSPGSDLAAHLGGALTGALLLGTGLLTAGVVRPDADTPDEGLQPLELTVAAIAMAAALAMAIGAALLSGRPWEFSAPPLTTRLALGDSGLSLEVPRGLAPRPPRRDGEAMRWIFGEELRDPMVVEVRVAPQLRGETIEAKYETILRTLPPGESAGPAVRLDQVAGRPVLVFDRRTETGMRVREWVTERGDWVVMLRAVSVEQFPPGWEFARELLVRSLREDEPGPLLREEVPAAN